MPIPLFLDFRDRIYKRILTTLEEDLSFCCFVYLEAVDKPWIVHELMNVFYDFLEILNLLKYQTFQGLQYIRILDQIDFDC